MASTLTCVEKGKTYPLDFKNVGPENKTANYCFDLAKQSILMAENTFQCNVVGFLSNNEAKMVAVRRLLQEWRPDIIVYGCSAHNLNLVEAKAIMNNIITVNKFFRDHHRPGGWLKEKKGVSPQLLNQTRWTSQRSALFSFIVKHPMMVEIRDEYEEDMKEEVRKLLDDRHAGG